MPRRISTYRAHQLRLALEFAARPASQYVQALAQDSSVWRLYLEIRERWDARRRAGRAHPLLRYRKPRNPPPGFSRIELPPQ